MNALEKEYSVYAHLDTPPIKSTGDERSREWVDYLKTQRGKIEDFTALNDAMQLQCERAGHINIGLRRAFTQQKVIWDETKQLVEGAQAMLDLYDKLEGRPHLLAFIKALK